MKSVWTRGVRPRVASSCTIHSDSCSSILARRTTSAPGRRRLQGKDAFAILLAPVLTAALVADVTGKDRRRKQWESKIAEVLGEIENLKAEEQKTWRTLQRRTLNRASVQQRRGYATAAYAFADDLSENQDLEEPLWDEESRSLDATPIAKDINTYNSNASQESMDIMRHFRRLLATRMAMRMMLNTHTSTNHKFMEEAGRVQDVLQTQSYDLNSFGRKLRELTHTLNSLSNSLVIQEGRSWLEASPESVALDSKIKDLSSGVKAGKLMWTAFTMHIAQSILQSSAYPTMDGYFHLLRAFSGVGLKEFSYEVIDTIRAGQGRLNPSLIYNIIIEYARKRDTYHLDGFLKMLTKVKRSEAPGQEWKWKQVNGVRFACPVNSNPGILQALIYASLRCEQYHKAEALAVLMRGKSLKPERVSYLIINFLNQYSAVRDWNSGAVWLNSFQQEVSHLATNSLELLQRLIFVTLDFCIQCDRQQLYAAILNAVAAAHISPPAPNIDRPIKIGSRYWAVRSEWEQLYRKQLTGSNVESDAVLAQNFQESLKSVLRTFGLFSEPADTKLSDHHGNPEESPFITRVPPKKPFQTIVPRYRDVEAPGRELSNIRQELDTIRNMLETQPKQQSRRSRQSQPPHQSTSPKIWPAPILNVRKHLSPLAPGPGDSEATSDPPNISPPAFDSPFLRDLQLRIAHVCRKRSLDDKVLTAAVMKLVSTETPATKQVYHLNRLSNIFRHSDAAMLVELQEYVGVKAQTQSDAAQSPSTTTPTTTPRFNSLDSKQSFQPNTAERLSGSVQNQFKGPPRGTEVRDTDDPLIIRVASLKRRYVKLDGYDRDAPKPLAGSSKPLHE